MIAYRKLVQGAHVDPEYVTRLVDTVLLPLLRVRTNA
jgi:hypothetical protein